MEMYNEITNAMWASVPKAFFEAVVRIWWIFAMIVAVIAIRLYLALKHDVRTPLEFVGLIKKLVTKQDKIDTAFIPTIRKHDFPKDFEWINNYTYFKFGKYGVLRFSKKNSKRKNAFRLLTDAKGEFVKTQDIAEKLGIEAGEARIVMNELREKIKNIPKIAKYMDIETNYTGGYRLAINPLLLEQEPNENNLEA